jgi:serine/threonine protein kinase
MYARGRDRHPNRNEPPFVLSGEIGRGSDGIVVYEARRNTREDEAANLWQYAQKSITPRDDEYEEAKKTFTREVSILKAAQGDHVVKYYADYLGPGKLMALVMERATSSLARYLKPRHSIDNIEPRWFMCLARVVDRIHGIGIRHRDIKPDNILLREGKDVILADFGISSMTLGPTMPTTIPNHARGRTVAYCAPEVRVGSTRGRAGDIFSLGAVFLEMFVHRFFPSLRVSLRNTLVYRPEGSESESIISFSRKLEAVRKFAKTLKQYNSNTPKWVVKFVGMQLSCVPYSAFG